MKLHQWAEHWRVRNQLTQLEMAERLGLSRQSYASFENGDSEFRPANARKLISIIGEPPRKGAEDLCEDGDIARSPCATYVNRSERILLTPCPHCDEDVPVAYRGTQYSFCASCGKRLD